MLDNNKLVAKHAKEKSQALGQNDDYYCLLQLSFLLLY